jgi:chromosome segregation ATPase
MARLKSLGTIVMLLSSLWVTGCQTTSAGDRDRQAADTAAAQARSNESQAADAAKKALNARLDELQHRLDGMKTDAQPASAKARRELHNQVKALQDQVAQLRFNLSSESGRAEEWNRLKQSTNEAIQKIENKVDDLKRPQR